MQCSYQVAYFLDSSNKKKTSRQNARCAFAWPHIQDSLNFKTDESISTEDVTNVAKPQINSDLKQPVMG